MKNPVNKITNTPLMQSTVATNQYPSNQQNEMRVLTDNEVMSVAGGPEVDVESGGG